MTPFYIVMGTQKDGGLYKSGYPLASQKEALEEAKKLTIEMGLPSYVLETVAQVNLPKPEPIVTMKGD